MLGIAHGQDVCVYVSWSHSIPKNINVQRVLCSECNAAHGNHHQNAHLKVAQVHHIVTKPSYAANTQISIAVSVFIHFLVGLYI